MSLRPTTAERGPSLLAAALAPLQRLDTAPWWGKLLAAAVAAVQYVKHDLFAGALVLILVSGVVDYWAGVRAARFERKYDPRVAHAGAVSKTVGLLLLMMLRLAEFWASAHGLVDTGGALSTAVAISLFAVDLQSVAHHREVMGARPIPVLGKLVEMIQAVLTKRVETAVPAAPPADAPR